MLVAWFNSWQMYIEKITDFKERPIYQRDQISQILEKPGQQVVIFVSYTDQARINSEWVYNGAEPLKQNVIWARKLGKEQDLLLLSNLNKPQAYQLIVGQDLQILRYNF